MPSPFYYDVLDAIQQTLLPRTYLEIGVRHGASAALALGCTRVVGVDPKPRILNPLPAGAVIEATTSDEFFSSGRGIAGFQGQAIDLAFIDGMHHWEFALRDFLNIERHTHSGSVVLIHDCLPRNADEASRQPRHGAWAGDVWKLLCYLHEERADLDLQVLDAGPTGLGVVQRLNPARGEVDLERILDRYHSLEFGAFESDLLPHLNLVRGDWARMRSVFPAEPWQRVHSVADLVEERALRKPSVSIRLLRLRRRLLSSRVGRGAIRAMRRRPNSSPAG